MADGTNNMPDQSQNMQALQQEMMRRMQGDGPGGILFLPNADVGIKLQNVAPFAKGPPALFAPSKKKKWDSEALVAQFKKMKDEAGVVYSGDLPVGTPVSPMPTGDSGLPAIISASRGNSDGGSALG